MKKKITLFTVVCSLMLLLTSCNLSQNKSNSNGSESSGITGETSGDTTSSSGNPDLSGKSFTVYAINDFHGAVEETDECMGLAKMGSFFKKKGEEENAITIDSGDTWQGSIYSNYNHGALIQDVMCYAKFDVRTVGNHDFDWGVDYVKANTARSYNGYVVPTLAANIYDYNFETKQFGETQQADIGQKTSTIVLENGIKVGIVGAIGSDQITSITSTYVENIGFKPHIAVIKEEATKLRNQGCDYVICSYHGDQNELINNDLDSYIDLALCAHTHQTEAYIENNLLYLQAGKIGRHYGEISVTFTSSSKRSSYHIYSYRQNKSLFNDVDPQIQQIINSYNAEVDEVANNIVVQSASGTFGTEEQLPNLMCKAIIDKTIADGYNDVLFATTNFGRATLSNNVWHFKDIFEAFPFENEIYIIEATGQNIYNNLAKNWWCKNPSINWNTTKIALDQKYKVAVIDYLAVHTDDARNYDFWSSANGTYLHKLEGNYRDILLDWLSDKGYTSDSSKTLYSTDYASSVDSFDLSNVKFGFLEYTITFDTVGGSVLDESQLVRVGNTSQYYSELYPSPNPTKDGYNFAGWYLNPTYTVSANQLKVDSNRTLYAKWDEAAADNTILPEEVDFTGTYYDYPAANGLTIRLCWDNSSYSSQYNQIQVNNYGFFELQAPNGYKFSHLIITIFGTYDNFTFSGDSYAISTSIEKGDIKSVYNFDADCKYLDISNRSGFTSYIISIDFELKTAA